MHSAADSPEIVFSIIIPVYNSAATLRRSLESVLRQSCVHYEIIVVDDGSTDGGAQLAAEILGARGRIIVQSNGGVSAARNRGVAHARGQLISFLDADDDWEEEYLAAVLSLWRRFPAAGLLATGFRQCFPDGRGVEIAVACGDRSGQELVTNYFGRAAFQQIVWTGATTIPAAVFREVGGFAAGVSHGEDLDLWARVGLKYPFAFDTAVLANYRVQRVLTAPRYDRLPLELAVVRSLRSALRDGLEECKRRAVVLYARRVVVEAAYMVGRRSDGSRIAALLQENDGWTFCPLLTSAAASRATRWAAWLYLYVRAKLQSRIALAALGGVRVQGGTAIRLAR